MEEYLEKKVFVYRKSYAFYSKIDTTLLVSKFLFSSSGLSAFAFITLASLSLGTALIEVLELSLKIGQRKEEYRFTYKFYQELLNLFKVEELSDFDVSKREAEFIKTTNFFPGEKYIKQVKLNGYKFTH
jgi:cystathionine beta-lyase/cystathionine gamma-synthase